MSILLSDLSLFFARWHELKQYPSRCWVVSPLSARLERGGKTFCNSAAFRGVRVEKMIHYHVTCPLLGELLIMTSWELCVVNDFSGCVQARF